VIGVTTSVERLLGFVDLSVDVLAGTLALE
jgi:hypothetical protein